MFKEFKEFAMKGNIIDLAVGVIIGGAFQKIVTSLVNDIIMPLINILTGKVNFSELSIKIGNSSILYGNFLTAVLDFLLMAFSIFLFIKYINKLNKKLENVKSTNFDKLNKKFEKMTNENIERLNKKFNTDKFSKMKRRKTDIQEETPIILSTKQCPYCLSEINIKATRCPYCTSEIKGGNSNDIA